MNLLFTPTQVENELVDMKKKLKSAEHQSQETCTRIANLMQENVALKEEQDQLKDRNTQLKRDKSEMKVDLVKVFVSSRTS